MDLSLGKVEELKAEISSILNTHGTSLQRTIDVQVEALKIQKNLTYYEESEELTAEYLEKQLKRLRELRKKLF